MKQYIISLAIMMAMMCSNLSVIVAQNETDGGNTAGKVRYPCWEKGFKLRLDADLAMPVSTKKDYFEVMATGTLSLDYQINTLVQAGIFTGAIIETLDGTIAGIPLGIDVRAYAGRHTRRIRLFYAAQVGVMIKGNEYKDMYIDYPRDYKKDSYDGIPCESRFYIEGDGIVSVKPGYLFSRFSLGFECRSGFHLGLVGETFGIEEQINVYKHYQFDNRTALNGKTVNAKCTTLHAWMVGLTAGWNISITRPNRSLYK